LGRLDLQDELAALVGHPVDLVPRDSVTNPYRRQSIWENRYPRAIIEGGPGLGC
jgi:predicted nucleotidyltransferase